MTTRFTLSFLLCFSLQANGHEGHKKNAPIKKNTSNLPALVLTAEISKTELTNQNNNPVKLNSFLGTIWVADFIYTTCADECPLMTSKMRSIQQKFKDSPDVKFASFTTDPQVDTPLVLKSYADRFKINDSNWYFLTGEKSKIITLAVEGFRSPLSQTSKDHSLDFMLVDAQGKLRGSYDSSIDSELNKLESDIASLIKENRRK